MSPAPAAGRRTVLHVGLMKSGTSFMQSLLFANKEHLRAQGVQVPGKGWGEQVRATQAALRGRTGDEQGHWGKLMARLERTDATTSVISMEFLGPALPAIAKAIVADLARHGGRVEVVVSARDLNRSLVSMWQETVQNGRSWGFEDYLADAEAKRPRDGEGTWDRETPGGTFWRQQHQARILKVWSDLVGVEHTTLVTLPHPGADRDLLTQRFEELLGLEVGSGFAERRPPQTGNPSLGLPSVLVLRRLNELLDARGLAFPAGSRLRKAVLAKEVLNARRKDEPAPGLPVPAWMAEQSEQMTAMVRRIGPRLVGSYDELRPVDVPGVSVADVDPHAVTEAALDALAGLVAHKLKPAQDA